MTQPQPCDLIIHSASQMLTLRGGPQRGSSLGDLHIIEDGGIAIKDGMIAGVGKSIEIESSFNADEVLDARGRVLLPGFVDPHTHLIWAGDRAGEFELRIRGASYMEIMAAGGGIASTVEATRSADLDELVELGGARAQTMFAHGTTTAEAKSGYGLDISTELRMLEAIKNIDDHGPIELTPTFLGAHALPPEFAGTPESGYETYTKFITEEALPRLVEWWGANHADMPLPFVDVFCEEGAFSLEQSRKILFQAKELGFPLKIHADEFVGIGGTGLAVELGAISADHLVHTPEEDILALGKSGTVAVALPCTPFGLAEHAYTPADKFLAADGILAIATDLNPGTAWCESMQFAIALACRYMQLTPAQAIAAGTINAAAAIGRENRIGSLEVGKQADVLILETADYGHLGYRFGTNLVASVVKKGVVYSRDTILRGDVHV
ncbi:MAG: imidazolonepropionase [Anaerolineales bacterium]